MGVKNNQVTVTLEKINEKNFEEFKEWVIQDYAQEKVKAGNWSEDEALLKSKAEFEKLLPQGTKTPDQFLYYILNGDNLRVGHIWLDMIVNEDGWLHSLLVYENFRRLGYAYHAIELIETILIDNGCDKNGLHVFRHNKSAINLYKKSGYIELERSDEKNVYMMKQLK
jgi:ribosomal protein S18 acetylase RimI-like enzyme